MEIKKGTHNAMTGEASCRWCVPLIPFARCQCKGLVEQYREGSTLYDIRLRCIKGEWYGAHGPWRTKETAERLLDNLHDAIESPIHMEVTYEGTADEASAKYFGNYAEYLKSRYPKFIFHDFHSKRPWVTFCKGNSNGSIGVAQRFTVIKGWRCLLPIPWVWHLLCRHVMYQDAYNYVDFI